MERTKNFINIEYSAESAQELVGKQSVRTTFKLSERSIGALSILANQLGIKQKSLFDHLIDDMPALQVIAEESELFETPLHRVAKTYVISRRTLENLEKVASRYRTPRDSLVELSIERIMPLLLQEKEKHVQRKHILDQMSSLLVEGEKILEAAAGTLDADDPVFRKINQVVRTMKTCCTDIDDCVERGRKIEDF